MKKILLFVFVLFLSFSIANAEDWIINGSSVYINDSHVYLATTPHTLSGSDFADFELISKTGITKIDLVWGFDTTDGVRPIKGEYYNPHNATWNTSHFKYYDNVVEIDTTSEDCDWGNEYNTYKRNVTWTVTTNITYNDSEVVCFDNYTQDGNNYTVHWHTNHTEYREYKDVTDRISSKYYTHGGMNKWYYIKNFTVVPNQTYKARAELMIPPKLGENSGKYWFCVKPSSETISEAIASGHFYCIDPWYNISCNFKLQANFTNNRGSAWADRIWHVNLNLSGLNIDADCENLTWTNGSENTELSFNRVNCDPTGVNLSRFDMHVVNTPTGTSSVYMYYNCSFADQSDVDFASGISDLAYYWSFSNFSEQNATDHANNYDLNIASPTNQLLRGTDGARNFSARTNSSYWASFTPAASNNITFFKWERAPYFVGADRESEGRSVANGVHEIHGHGSCGSDDIILFGCDWNAGCDSCAMYDFQDNEWNFQSRTYSQTGSALEWRAYSNGSDYANDTYAGVLGDGVLWYLGKLHPTLGTHADYALDEYQMYYANFTKEEHQFIYDTYNDSLYSIGAEESPADTTNCTISSNYTQTAFNDSCTSVFEITSGATWDTANYNLTIGNATSDVTILITDGTFIGRGSEIVGENLTINTGLFTIYNNTNTSFSSPIVILNDDTDQLIVESGSKIEVE